MRQPVDRGKDARRAAKGGATRIVARKRHADRRPADRRADEGFLAALIAQFGDAPFPRGNLDAGRLSWLFGREVVPAEPDFDPQCYDALLRVDLDAARRGFPAIFDDIDDDGDHDGEAGPAEAPARGGEPS